MRACYKCSFLINFAMLKEASIDNSLSAMILILAQKWGDKAFCWGSATPFNSAPDYHYSKNNVFLKYLK